MGNESYSFKLKSHPEKLLVDHLRNVGMLSSEIVAGKVLNLEEASLLRDVAYLMGITHDLGKATSFFQDYLAEEDEKRKRSLKARDNTHHGLLSAFFTYAVVREYLEQSGKRGGIADYIPILSFFAVKRHHGNLQNAMGEIDDVGAEEDKTLKLVEEQLNALDKTEIEQIFKSLLSEEITDLEINSNDIINYVSKDAIQDIGRKARRPLRKLQSKGDILPYFIAQFLYSTLLDADKMDAALSNANLERIDPRADLVDRYREAKGFSCSTKGIDQLRNRIYEDAIEAIESWNLDDRIISLNVPTGTGKTLTSLSISLKLREKLSKVRGFKPRIIYALPFLSIIDQNYDVFEDVVGQDGETKDSRMLLKHHHLADVSYRTEDDEFESDKSLLLIEGWNAEIIVTTFWQLFHTLFSNKNRHLRKFNKLANSIIIMDEVQAVPHHYWLLIHDALKMLCDKFNSYVVLVTATQPLIFDEAGGEIQEITKGKEAYFQGLDRIELLPRVDEVLSLEDFKSLLAKELVGNQEKDYLIILNTISSASEVYDFVRGLDLENTNSVYLSTHIVPKERLKRIRDIKDTSKKGIRKVIVSTQLIEAGVDIDADVIWRDFGPLDSINQVCGRCNRNSSKAEKGSVSVFILRDDNREFYKYIYDPFLMNKTYDILKLKDLILESQFLDLNKKYYKAVKAGMGDQESKANLECLTLLGFKGLSERFKLIEEDGYKVDVFVEVDEEAAGIWKRYLEIKSEKNPLVRRNEFLKIKKVLNEHIISVSRKFAASLLDENLEMGYISRDELPYYYDPDTGFRTKGAGEGSMIF